MARPRPSAIKLWLLLFQEAWFTGVATGGANLRFVAPRYTPRLHSTEGTSTFRGDWHDERCGKVVEKVSTEDSLPVPQIHSEFWSRHFGSLERKCHTRYEELRCELTEWTAYTKPAQSTLCKYVHISLTVCLQEYVCVCVCVYIYIYRLGPSRLLVGKHGRVGWAWVGWGSLAHTPDHAVISPVIHLAHLVNCDQARSKDCHWKCWTDMSLIRFISVLYGWFLSNAGKKNNWTTKDWPGKHRLPTRSFVPFAHSKVQGRVSESGLPPTSPLGSRKKAKHIILVGEYGIVKLASSKPDIA